MIISFDGSLDSPSKKWFFLYFPSEPWKLELSFSIDFLMISEKKLINDLEKLYILLNFESFKIMIYIIPTKILV